MAKPPEEHGQTAKEAELGQNQDALHVHTAVQTGQISDVPCLEVLHKQIKK